MNWNALQATIRQVRTEKGLTQQALAEMTGISRANIARLETSEKNPTVGTLEKVCKALEIEVEAVRKPENDDLYSRIKSALLQEQQLTAMIFEDLYSYDQQTMQQEMIAQIRDVMVKARRVTALQINHGQLFAYWNIGRIIVEHEQESNKRAAYGQDTIKQLSRELFREFGKGFSLSNVYHMRQFYLDYPKFQSVTGKLTWTHYCELMSISDTNRRSFYEKECWRSGWSVRELKRQIATSLFERILLSNGKANKKKVLELAAKGQEMISPEDIVKDPYVLEFLNIPDSKPVLESELEKALVRRIEDFLLELGRGFMFVGTQQRVTLGNTHYYVDMVFYNREIHAYVLIELKTGKLMPEAVGQMNMYLNYYSAEVNGAGDNPPMGIILCADKDRVSAEYALGGLSNNVFASTYTYVIPEKEKLIAQVEAVLERWEEKTDAPNEMTAAAIEEGRRIASDPSVKGFSGIDDLRKALED